MGLQSKTVDDLEAELGLPASQILALYNKSMRRMVASLRAVQEMTTRYSLLTTHYSLLTTHYSLLTAHTAHCSLLKTSYDQQQEKDAAADLPTENAASEATAHMAPLRFDLGSEMAAGEAKELRDMKEAQTQKQQARSR